MSAPQDGLSSNATEVSHDERLLRCLFAASWYRAALLPGVGFDRRMVKETYATAPTSACPLDFFRFAAAAWVGSNLKNVTAPVHKRMPRTRGELILPFCTSALPGLAIGFQAVVAGPCLGRRLARNFDRRYC